VIKENLKALIDYRLQQADESLQAAAVLFEKKLYRPSVNRSYYAMYYAVMGLLAAEKKETSKHSGVIALFDRDFVKKGLFTKDFSRWLHAAFDMRQRSDYAAGHTVLIGDAQKLLENAQAFVAEVKSVIDRFFSSLPSAE
jgi:uncharacterized protein (UPF0332 family)